MDLHAFLQLCPKNITHFTFDTSSSSRHAMIMDRDYSIAPPPAKEPSLPQLQFTYLNLHATLYRYEVDYILQQCPQLRCLVFDSVKPYGHTMIHVIEACVQLCPTLECLAWGRIRPDFVSHWKSKVSLPKRKATEREYICGLQEIVCGSFYHGGHSFTQMLLAHRRTLRTVRLERLQNQPVDPWYPITPRHNVTFNHLQTIHIDNIHVNAESLARWIYHCPQLEELSLHTVTADETSYWLDRVFQALGSSNARLKRLHVTHDRFADSNNDATSHTEDPIYNHLIQARHRLESIRLSGNRLVTNAILEALTEKSNASTLKRVALDYSATDNHRLDLTTDGMRAFAHNLHWELDELGITEHQEDGLLTDELLMLLSSKVRRLSLKGCTKLTGDGLKAFIDHGHGNSLVSMQLVECANIDESRNSVEYARTVLGQNNVQHVSSERNADDDIVSFVYV
ncbi:hypothetical protein BDB00DRAFT_783412 [Zychaea mexicana]|uniref:uncharacterized protein n=1 Tax=Zychaea mexicana TaxID=64656 RepID=UPI0022FE05C5|nr:uncharacterized protein BDB00DRAFT_783412 [Zychaea mexicana]KAI9499350.1 hypothetical protein BDB00DRAFT_783412 [Zychaea mexicana]